VTFSRGCTFDDEPAQRLPELDPRRRPCLPTELDHAANGGDLGWMFREKLDEKFADVAFKMPVGIMSGIIESSFGYHLILVEERDEEGIEPFESARSAIREFLMSRDAAKVMETVSKLSNELRRTSKVALFPENIQ